MIHFTCDLCGKEMYEEDREHYVACIEIRPAHDGCQLTEDDLDADNLEKVSQLLESGTDPQELEDALAPVRMRIDLCAECRDKFLKDPFNAHATAKFDFSKN